MVEARARKLADRIKVIVAETLELKVKDPRLGFITVTDVRVTGDLPAGFGVLHRAGRRLAARGDRRSARERERRPALRGRAADRCAAHALAHVLRRRRARERAPTSRTCSRRSPRQTPRCTAPRRARLRGRGRPLQAATHRRRGRRAADERGAYG